MVKGINLELKGEYTSQQLAMIFTGLGKHVFDVNIEISEKIYNYECDPGESL